MRRYSITHGPKLAGFETIAWNCTLADCRLDIAEHYRADIRVWAGCVNAVSEAFVMRSS